jgi:hypothetical protein
MASLDQVRLQHPITDQDAYRRAYAEADLASRLAEIVYRPRPRRPDHPHGQRRGRPLRLHRSLTRNGVAAPGPLLQLADPVV